MLFFCPLVTWTESTNGGIAIFVEFSLHCNMFAHYFNCNNNIILYIIVLMRHLLSGQLALPIIFIYDTIVLISWCQNIGKSSSFCMQVVTYVFAWRDNMLIAVFVNIYMYSSLGPAVYYVYRRRGGIIYICRVHVNFWVIIVLVLFADWPVINV